MNKDEIVQVTINFLSTEFEVNPADILPENNLKETLDLDSLDYVDLVVVVEENLGFQPTREDLEQVVSFDDFYNLAKKRISNS
jgi:acyl carrier protein